MVKYRISVENSRYAIPTSNTLLYAYITLPFGMLQVLYTSLRYGHLNTTPQSWKEKEVTLPILLPCFSSQLPMS